MQNIQVVVFGLKIHVTDLEFDVLSEKLGHIISVIS